MKLITISEAQKKTSPNSISLVCTQTPDGTTNLAPISWWTYLANRPPMIGFAMSNKGYSGELLSKTCNAVLSIPGETIAEEVFQCGCVSGQEICKAKKFNVALTGSPVKYPVHSKLAFACTLEDTVNVGDHIFYICKVDEIYYNEKERQIYSWDGYSRLAPL